MISKPPLVSIIIPAFNSEEYICKSIDSALAQSYKHIEIIVVNDGSTDRTQDILESYSHVKKIHRLQHPDAGNKGVSISRKLGVAHAQGEFIAFLDADDLYEPQKIETQLNAFQSESTCILCHCDVSHITDTPSGRSREKQFFLGPHRYAYAYGEEDYFLINNHICNSSVMVRTSPIKKLTFQFQQLFQYEDWLLWILLADAGPFIYLPDKLTGYRYHTGCATAKIDKKPLIGLYSKLELYLTVCALASNKKHIQKAEALASQTLTELKQYYARETNRS